MASSVTVLRTVREVREWRGDAGDVGLVPTMGALHGGHRRLVERAAADGVAIASIFVNPTQFAPNEDYRAYPRSEEADLALLADAGCAAAFIPGVEEMYRPGEDMRVVPGDIASRLEGAARPGHFAGVCTVVAKLFGMVRPARTYFSHKDFQQLRVVQTMVRDLALWIRVVPFEIVREPDGLAMSSRNAYLTPDERRRAVALSRGLFAARDEWARGTRDAATLRATVRGIASDAGTPEYVSIADPVTLRELEGRAERAVVSLACRVGRARLIDNVLLGMSLDELARL
ncbi:MAG: pantoate--beta-alanine ligase [Chloroflexota bacterium]|nr:pantoate--beta-alanine ligase [Chloroflexota bacterium]MDE3193432.1 pantoate--beta-alanine ligase [Chloroflexota bacterium]